jgi:hypothetical protein
MRVLRNRLACKAWRECAFRRRAACNVRAGPSLLAKRFRLQRVIRDEYQRHLQVEVFLAYSPYTIGGRHCGMCDLFVEMSVSPIVSRQRPRIDESLASL